VNTTDIQEEALALVRRAALEESAALIESLAANYPADIWPEDSDVRDAIAATALRKMLPRFAASIRKLMEEKS
jgi:hypothetical protein